MTNKYKVDIMQRIINAFKNKAKVAYLTAGDVTNSLEYFNALIQSGVNILEVGIPFSDPVADGAVIQLAMKKAIDMGTTTTKVLEIVTSIRKHSDVAIILFTYLNPIIGNLEDFIVKAKNAGADGILVVDMPFEESSEFRFLCDKHGIAAIVVAAPSTPLERIKLLADNSNGFLYYACRSGTTGVKNELPLDLVDRINEIKKYSRLPIAVGFGVSNKDMVDKILAIADGVVVGSYFVNAIANNKSPEELGQMADEVFNAN